PLVVGARPGSVLANDDRGCPLATQSHPPDLALTRGACQHHIEHPRGASARTRAHRASDVPASGPESPWSAPRPGRNTAATTPSPTEAAPTNSARRSASPKPVGASTPPRARNTAVSTAMPRATPTSRSVEFTELAVA